MRVPIILILILFSVGCQETPPRRVSTVGQTDPTGPWKEYQLKGEIISVDAEAKTVTVKHDTIEGFMTAMTMTFPVPDDAERGKVKAGDMVTAQIYQRPSDAQYWISRFELVPESAPTSDAEGTQESQDPTETTVSP